MKTDYLLLKFHKDLNLTSLKLRQSNNVSLKNQFKIFTTFDRFLPFVCEVQNDCSFTVKVLDYYGESLIVLSKDQIPHKIYKVQNKQYLVYFGEKIPCLEMGECSIPYSLKINDFYSEFFWVTDRPDQMVKFEIGNSVDFSYIPYSKGFKQIFYLDTSIESPDISTFTVSSKDGRGVVTTTYQKLTETFEFYWFNCPAHFKNFISSFETLDFVKISNFDSEVLSEPRQCKVKSKRNEIGFNYYDLEFSLPNSEYQEIGVCDDSKFENTSCFVSVPDDNCEIQSIKNIEIDCNIESDVSEVLVKCETDIIEEEPFFYATIIYN
jgi:hypothetical protein